MPAATLHPREHDRLKAVHETGLVGGDLDRLQMAAVHLAADICQVPIAAVSLIDASRQWFSAICGLTNRQTSRDAAFCAHTILSCEPLVVPDALRDPRFQDNPLVTGDPHIRFYAGIPLCVAGDLPLGALCVKDVVPRELSEQQLESLTTLAGLVAAQLELHRQNAHLAEARAAAEAASRAKTTFLANMSHEIRTPLTAILGYADLLAANSEHAGDSSGRRAMIDAIRNAGSHLLSLINDVLDLSRIEADRLSTESIETSLADVLNDVYRIVSPKALDKHLDLQTRIESPVPDRIMTDPMRVRQILVNLLGNAVKFTGRGDVCLRIHASGDTDPPSLRFDIQDTGPGMTEEQVGRLFQVFGQADDTITRCHGGSGLGLTISRRLATLMGGDVSVLWTRPGEGSCFRLALPLVEAPGARPLASFETDRIAAPVSATPQTLRARILLAEDGPDNQRLISFHLRRAGADVEVADNGRIALDKMRKAVDARTPYDLLVTDMQMPEMDGYSLVQTLRKDDVQTPIIALTAHAMNEDRVRCLAAGCDDYLTKPIDKSVLIARCAELLARTSGRSELPATSPVAA